MPSNGKTSGSAGKSHSSSIKRGGTSNIAKPGTVPVLKANRAEHGKLDTKGKWANWSDGEKCFKGK